MFDFTTHRARVAQELELCAELLAYHRARARTPDSVDAIEDLKRHRERLLDSPFRFHPVRA